MLFKRISRTAPEQVFVVVQNVHAGTMTAGYHAAWDTSSPDGVRVTQQGQRHRAERLRAHSGLRVQGQRLHLLVNGLLGCRRHPHAGGFRVGMHPLRLRADHDQGLRVPLRGRGGFVFEPVPHDRESVHSRLGLTI